MYRLNVDPTDYGFPEWVAQSSLKEERMEELSVPWERGEELQAFYREHRVIEKVNSLPLGLLLERHELRDLDLLQIDAEGYDYEILKTLDFNQHKPRFINYERALLDEDEPACRQMLMSHGYVLMDSRIDTLAILSS